MSESRIVERAFGRGRIRLRMGDITRQKADVIANAANSRLRGGGGVDGAIHRAAGPELMKACREIGSCPTGSAVLTPAFRLDARFVAHAVGPVWRGGDRGEPDLLASAYRSCLELAERESCRSIAFPSISTGVYGYPVSKAAPVALSVAADHLRDEESGLEDIVFVLFDADTFEAYRAALEEL